MNISNCCYEQITDTDSVLCPKCREHCDMLIECPDCDEGLEFGVCLTCNGAGEGQYDGTKCHHCKGRGEMQYECDTCKGSGWIPQDDNDD